MERMKSYVAPALAGLLVAAFVLQAVASARVHSLCNDEGKHLVTGWWHAKTRECCLGVDNAPLTAWFALPALLRGLSEPPGIRRGDSAHLAGNELIFSSTDPEGLLLASRSMTIAAGVVLLSAAAWLSLRLFGTWGALLTLTLLALDPNLIAHFSLVSTDALLAVTALVFLLTLDMFLRKPDGKRCLLCGTALGLALLAKFNALVLIPAAVVILPIYRRRLPSRTATSWSTSFLLAALCAAAVVWLGYGFHFSPRAPYLEFPGLVSGFDQARAYATSGMSSYFNGEIGASWPGYFPEVLLLKTPVPLLLLWGMTIALFIATKQWRKNEGLAPLAAALMFFGTATVSRLNIGARHILPTFVFMAVFCGALPSLLRELAPPGRKAVAAATWLLLLWLGIEAATIAPSYLSYFNQLAGGPQGGIRYLGDSNLDWGQDLKQLKRVMDARGIGEVILSYAGNTDPALYGIRYQLLPVMIVGSSQGDRVVDSRREILAVSTNNLQGIFMDDPEDLRWLLGREPFATAGFSIYLYDITGDAASHRRLSSLYARYGMAGLAAKERDKAIALGLAVR
jgi:hypothetical protein